MCMSDTNSKYKPVRWKGPKWTIYLKSLGSNPSCGWIFIKRIECGTAHTRWYMVHICVVMTCMSHNTSYYLFKIHLFTGHVVSILNSQPPSYITVTRDLFFTKFQSVYSPHAPVLSNISNINPVSDFRPPLPITKTKQLLCTFSMQRYCWFTKVRKIYCGVMPYDLQWAPVTARTLTVSTSELTNKWINSFIYCLTAIFRKCKYIFCTLESIHL